MKWRKGLRRKSLDFYKAEPFCFFGNWSPILFMAINKIKFDIITVSFALFYKRYNGRKALNGKNSIRTIWSNVRIWIILCICHICMAFHHNVFLNAFLTERNQDTLKFEKFSVKLLISTKKHSFLFDLSNWYTYVHQYHHQ